MRRFLLLLILGISGFALAEPSKEEKQGFQEMDRALEDGLFDLVIQRSEAFVKKFPNSELKSDVRWLQVRAHYYLGQYDAAASELKASHKQVSERYRSDYLLLQGEVANLREEWAIAEARYREYLEDYPKSKLRDQAQLGLGLSLLRQKKRG